MNRRSLLKAGGSALAVAASKGLGAPAISQRAAARTLRFVRALLDHLVRAQQNRWGYRKTERRGGLAVYDRLIFCRQLNGQLPRPRAA
jgi:hypothetical protein